MSEINLSEWFSPRPRQMLPLTDAQLIELMKQFPETELPSVNGYVIELFDGSAWLSKDLLVTDKFEDRGVWPTSEEAERAMVEALRK